MTTRKDKNTLNPAGKDYSRRTLRLGAIMIVFSIIMSGFYLYASWNKYENAAASEAITLAQSLATLIEPEQIAELSGGTDDLEKPEYIITKRNLMKLVETETDINFAYLMGIKDDNIVFLLDSESPDSPEYSPPGQIYREADENTWDAFRLAKQFCLIQKQIVGAPG